MSKMRALLGMKKPRLIVVVGGTQVSLGDGGWSENRLIKRPRKMGGNGQSVGEKDLKLRWNGLCWKYQS